ncbi:uncharacterized protein LOC125199100 [Salvia hispanica]|uniref:uncharacterized protein LOC125199100 n=1 Tax=Salvia hispanica TaxID=49212 RepID=UPI0020096D8E|nr:uncharacterized protein LOC125199100 [Salvia hispanica]
MTEKCIREWTRRRTTRKSQKHRKIRDHITKSFQKGKKGKRRLGIFQFLKKKISPEVEKEKDTDDHVSSSGKDALIGGVDTSAKGNEMAENVMKAAKGVGMTGLSLNKANELIIGKRARAKESLKILQLETTTRDKAYTSNATGNVTESPDMSKGSKRLRESVKKTSCPGEEELHKNAPGKKDSKGKEKVEEVVVILVLRTIVIVTIYYFNYIRFWSLYALVRLLQLMLHCTN